MTREQMASFIVRTLKVTWRFNTLAFVTDCSGSMPEVCTDPDSTWGFDAVDGVIVLRHGWALDPHDLTNDPDETLEVRYLIDGVEKPAAEVRTQLNGITYRSWLLEITPGDTPARFQLEVQWIRPSLGGHLLSTILTLDWPRPEPDPIG